MKLFYHVSEERESPASSVFKLLPIFCSTENQSWISPEGHVLLLLLEEETLGVLEKNISIRNGKTFIF